MISYKEFIKPITKQIIIKKLSETLKTPPSSPKRSQQHKTIIIIN